LRRALKMVYDRSGTSVETEGCLERGAFGVNPHPSATVAVRL
jgi:hypothetical protein